VIDLGNNVSTEIIVEKVKETNAPFLGLSALLTTTMRVMEEVLDALNDAGLRNQVKVLVGGAPTSAKFAESIGADAHCSDAFSAIDILKKLQSA
jgi:5-methyltetrahydrofolate--homocysteine methyltransferase